MALAKFSEWVEFYENENAGGAVNMQMPPSTGAFTTGVEEPEVSEAEARHQLGQFKNQFENLMKKISKSNQINKTVVREMIHTILTELMGKAKLSGTEETALQRAVQKTSAYIQ
jgi:hypothetical protein